MKKVKRLIYDLETSPNTGYFWRTGYNLSLTHDNIIKERAIICIAWTWEDSKYVYSYTWDKGDDKQMIKDFLVVAEEADELIAHNGDKFDMRWFQGRCLIHGLPPLPKFKTVDTLKIARKHFNLNSNRLDYLGKLLLNEGKIHTDFDLWKCVMAGNKKALKEMVTYCEGDVCLLERVWKRLEPWHKPATHAGVHQGLTRWSCPHCASESVRKKKTNVSAAGIRTHQMQCNCGKYFSIPENVFSDYLLAKGEKHD